MSSGWSSARAEKHQRDGEGHARPDKRARTPVRSPVSETVWQVSFSPVPEFDCLSLCCLGWESFGPANCF
jgi:hypothetical protein